MPVFLPDDDPRPRQRLIGRRFNAAVVRVMGTELLTVRIDLDIPPPADAPRPAGPARWADSGVTAPLPRR